jgi:hypothetical protein
MCCQFKYNLIVQWKLLNVRAGKFKAESKKYKMWWMETDNIKPNVYNNRLFLLMELMDHLKSYYNKQLIT